jgi:hypothetical protein
VASHASNSKSALSPARQRINSTSQRGRPTPGTGSGVDGSAETRQRVVAAVGWPKSEASVCRLQRRSAMPIRPRPFRSELESTRRGHGQAGDLPHHGAQASVPQAFFKAGEDGLLVAAFEIDDAVGIQPGLGERRRKQIQSDETPEDLAVGASSDARGKKRGSRAINRAIAAAGDLMQCAKRQRTTRKPRVHRWNSEG